MFKSIALTTLAAVSVASAQQAPPTPAPAPAPAKEAKLEKPKADPSKPFDVIFSKMIDLMEGALTEINAVTDEASAKKAVEKIKALQPQSDALGLLMGKAGDPNKEEQQVLMAKWGPYFRTVMNQMIVAQMKLQRYPELSTAFDSLQPKPKKAEAPTEPKKEDTPAEPKKEDPAKK